MSLNSGTMPSPLGLALCPPPTGALPPPVMAPPTGLAPPKPAEPPPPFVMYCPSPPAAGEPAPAMTPAPVGLPAFPQAKRPSEVARSDATTGDVLASFMVVHPCSRSDGPFCLEIRQFR